MSRAEDIERDLDSVSPSGGQSELTSRVLLLLRAVWYWWRR